ncbi:hypothetical protein ABT144_25205 [Streptomyces sp. NPDC002039]|uniref:hypothetical protein n=1 Tax=Streptomyces sp. NPDC002039 TaxID=3154660 RepID=UPI00332A7C72
MNETDYAVHRDAGAAAPDERRRIAAVPRRSVLDTPSDRTFDKIASLAARVFDVPVATVDGDRARLKAVHGLQGVREVPRTEDNSMLGDEGLTRHPSAHPTRGVDDPPATVHALFTDPGTGVSDDTALLALSVPPRRTPPPAQENR